MFHCIVLQYSRSGRRLGSLLDASQHSVFTYFTPQNPPPSLQTLQILLIFTFFWGKTVSFTFEEFGNRSLFMLFWKLVVLSFVCAVTKKVHGSHPGFWAIVRFWSNNEWRSKWYTTQQGDSYTSCPAKKLIWLCQEILNKMQWQWTRNHHGHFFSWTFLCVYIFRSLRVKGHYGHLRCGVPAQARWDQAVREFAF